MSVYGYTDRNLLGAREHYHYSRLQGPDFLTAYRDARRAGLAALPDTAPLPLATTGTLPDGTAPIGTASLLDALECDPVPDWIDRLVQRFEVTKRLYATYDARLRKGDGPVDDLTLYARLAALLARDTARLDRLNALLKLNDLLLSQPPAALSSVAGTLRGAVQAERDAVAGLRRAA